MLSGAGKLVRTIGIISAVTFLRLLLDCFHEVEAHVVLPLWTALIKLCVEGMAGFQVLGFPAK